MVNEGGAKDTTPPFSKEEVARIREAVIKVGTSVDCPRCGSPLTFEAVTGEAPGSSWWINCTECRRNLVVLDLTQRRVSEDDERVDWRG
jgi:transposase-like protein